MTESRPTITRILREFFDSQLAGTTGLRRSRIEAVELRLRECVEAEGDRILVSSDLAILAAERQLEPTGAVARLMHADDLVFVLSLYLGEPWLEHDPVDLRLQIRLVERLTARLLANGLVSGDELACPLYEIEGALGRARRALTVRER